MASQISTNYCYRCNHYPEPDEGPLKRCGSRCSLHYCSTDCKRNDWPRHKSECRILANGGQVQPRVRTTMRLNGEALANVAAAERGEAPNVQADPDTVYYLRTSKPHIKDISISGPYYPLDNVMPQILQRLWQEESAVGIQIFDDIVRGNGLLGMQHFNAPLPDGNIMKIELLRETNAELAHALPCPVWHVVVSSPALREPRAARVTVESMELRGSFLRQDAANARAREVLDKLKAIAGRGASSQQQVKNGLVSGFVIPADRRNVRAIEVRCDDGTVNHGTGAS